MQSTIDVDDLSPSELEELHRNAHHFEKPHLIQQLVDDQNRWWAPWITTKEGEVALLSSPEADYREFHGVDPR